MKVKLTRNQKRRKARKNKSKSGKSNVTVRKNTQTIRVVKPNVTIRNKPIIQYSNPYIIPRALLSEKEAIAQVNKNKTKFASPQQIKKHELTKFRKNNPWIPAKPTNKNRNEHLKPKTTN